ncbi:uncharacterized protein ACNLHF_013980 [Anomaloglossus baeobatrachus]|uniref:uncharacterized protein LOC142297225 n=1 Tax=Anomaloglossus baeobatrachus TaxID=238106 RepID=UPI003F508841
MDKALPASDQAQHPDDRLLGQSRAPMDKALPASDQAQHPDDRILGHSRAPMDKALLASYPAPHHDDRWWCRAQRAGRRRRAPCLLDLCDELLLMILELLDPFSLIHVSGVCGTLYRVSSTDSLWAQRCKITFGHDFRTGCADYTPKEAFKLMYMWKDLYRTLPYNRPLQDLLFSELPLEKYWVRWLTLETIVPLPAIQRPDHEIEDIWGITKDLLDEKHKVTDEALDEVQVSVYKYEWKDLYDLALLHHTTYHKMQLYVIKNMSSECHEELEWLYCQYYSNRFQWLFSYWLFGLSKSCGKQLQRIYLRWQRFDRKKVSNWGSNESDIQYLASLHSITNDFWNGKLANGDENIGIKSVENYFSMCRSLLAWILGRRWGKFKQKKVYKDALEGVYHMLKHVLKVSMVDHDMFWEVAKLQMNRVCDLERVAGNYVNWKLIDVLPCYRMFKATGDFVYVDQIEGFLFRKQLINSWIFEEENLWVVNLLPQNLLMLLEYGTKIYEDGLHGDTMEAHLSRIIWLYLHTGQQLYVDAMKGLVYECAYSNYTCQMYESASPAFV